MTGHFLNVSAEQRANTYHQGNITTSTNATTGAAVSFDFLMPVGLLVIFVMLSLLIVLTNGLVFALFILRKELRTATNYLLLGLAFADFLNGALNIPYFLSFMYGLLENSETIGLMNNAIHSFTALACIYHILLVTGDKYFAVVKPLRRHQVTKRKVAAVITSVWCISGLFSFIQFAWNTGTPYTQIIYTVILVITALLLPYPFIIFSFVKMFLKITKRATELQRGIHKQNSKVNRRNHRNNRKCVIIFSLMAFVYAVCWFPYYIITLMFLFGCHPSWNTLLAFLTIRYLTSLFNPIMYTFFKGDFKTALKSLRYLASQSSDAREIYLKSLSVQCRKDARYNDTPKDEIHAELVHFVNEN